MQKLLLKNRKAFYEFEILDKFEAGIVLFGHEVKSLRSGGGNFGDAFVSIQNGEAFLQNLHIALYQKATLEDYNAKRVRKLLLHKNEIIKITNTLHSKGTTMIPLAILLSNGKIKLELALARGKKLYDKRESIKKRDVKRRIETSLKD